VRDQVSLVAHGLVVKIICRRFQKPIEHERHEHRGDHHRNHVQEDDPGEDGFE
jgi:hypothetical protein